MLCLFVHIRLPEPLLNGHISGNLAAVRDINEAKLYYTSLWDSFGVERSQLGAIANRDQAAQCSLIAIFLAILMLGGIFIC